MREAQYSHRALQGQARREWRSCGVDFRQSEAGRFR